MGSATINLDRLQKDLESAVGTVTRMQKSAGKNWPAQYRTIGKDIQAFRRWAGSKQAHQLATTGVNTTTTPARSRGITAVSKPAGRSTSRIPAGRLTDRRAARKSKPKTMAAVPA